MSAVFQITRAELISAATERLFNSTSIQQIMQDAAKEFYNDNAMIAVARAAEMLDMDDQTFRRVYSEKVKRLGPRLSRIKVSELKQLVAEA